MIKVLKKLKVSGNKCKDTKEYNCKDDYDKDDKTDHDQEIGLFVGDGPVGSSRVDLQACKLEYSIVSPK